MQLCMTGEGVCRFLCCAWCLVGRELGGRDLGYTFAITRMAHRHLLKSSPPGYTSCNGVLQQQSHSVCSSLKAYAVGDANIYLVISNLSPAQAAPLACATLGAAPAHIDCVLLR
jgi:hypothetical protein